MARQPRTTRTNARAQAKKQRDAEVKRKASALKKRGLIYQSKSLRNKAVTDYMRKRVRELEGVLSSELVFVEAPERVASQYHYTDEIKRITKKGRGGKRKGILVPAPTDGSRVDIDPRRNLIRNIRKLGDGYVLERIELPVDVTNVGEFIAWIDSGEPERLKYPNEYFGLRIFGNGSLSAIPNTETLSQYIKVRYQLVLRDEELELNPSDDDAPVALELFRVWPPEAWENMIAEEQAAYKASPEYAERQARKRKKRNEQARRRARLKKERMMRETPEYTGRALDALKLSEAKKQQRRKREREKKRKQRSKKK